jgi:hypothetical protein
MVHVTNVYVTSATRFLATDVRFRPSKPETIWQVSSESTPECFLLVFWNNVEAIVVSLEVFVLSQEICNIVAIVSTSASSTFLAATISTKLLKRG